MIDNRLMMYVPGYFREWITSIYQTKVKNTRNRHIIHVTYKDGMIGEYYTIKQMRALIHHKAELAGVIPTKEEVYNFGLWPF